MRLSSIVALLSCVSSINGAAIAGRDEPDAQIDDLLAQAQKITKQTLEADNTKRTLGKSCTLKNLSIRRQWDDLSKPERKAYTDAVLCLQKKAAHASPDWAPGAKSRFDDWVATHISQSLTIHYTGTFLAWHRWFTWLYEQALREECGYTGAQPYWDWAKTARTGLENSPIFDGSDYSMSGNGARDEQDGDKVRGDLVLILGDLPSLTLPSGSGGGCVASGPFKGASVNMGPAALSLPDNITLSVPNPLEYNPRCLKRDLTDAINQRFANATAVLHTIRQQAIMDFQMIMQGIPGTGDIGIHGGGHYSIGGDPGGDVFVSPSDPIFYLHHSAIDRIWWIWQTLDLSNRVYGKNAINGTGTFLNMPPSPETTFDTEIQMGSITDEVVKMRDMMSTTSGPFCYMYA